MKLYTNKDLRAKYDCYDPSWHFEESKGYTLLDYLNHETCPAKDKIWCVTRFLDDRSNRLFAVWCAKEAFKHVENPDPRSLKAIEVAERFANGEALSKELYEANREAFSVGDDCYAYIACYASFGRAGGAAYDTADVLANAVVEYIVREERSPVGFHNDVSLPSYDVKFFCFSGYKDACTIASRNERKRQIEKLKKEIQKGNWKEK